MANRGNSNRDPIEEEGGENSHALPYTIGG